MIRTCQFFSADSMPNPRGLKIVKLYEAPEAAILHIFLQPGQAVPPHTTPVNVSFYVLQGTLDIEIGDERITVQADTLVESPAAITHALYNHSDQLARVMVIKHPNPSSLSH